METTHTVSSVLSVVTNSFFCSQALFWPTQLYFLLILCSGDPKDCKETKPQELVQEVEQSQPETVGLTSTHSTASRTKLLKRSWTILSGVAQSKRHQVDVGILTSIWLSATVLEFSPENEGCLHATACRLKEGSDCLCICTVQQFRVSGLRVISSWGPGKVLPGYFTGGRLGNKREPCILDLYLDITGLPG